MTFDVFGDFETRGYLRNIAGLKDLQQVKTLEYISFQAGLEDAIKALNKPGPLTYQNILDTHRILFSSVYPWAGQDRTATAPNVAITKGGIAYFADSLEIRRAAEHSLAVGAAAIAKKPGEVMGYLAYAHPFLEGNGRTIMLVHSEMCRRAGIHIDWKQVDKTEYLKALSDELLRPGKGALDRFLSPYVHERRLEASEIRTQIGEIKGLSR